MESVSPAALPESLGRAPLAHPCTSSWYSGNSPSLRLVLRLLSHSIQGKWFGACKNSTLRSAVISG